MQERECSYLLVHVYFFWFSVNEAGENHEQRYYTHENAAKNPTSVCYYCYYSYDLSMSSSMQKYLNLLGHNMY